MIFKMIHDVYGLKTIPEDGETPEHQEEYIVRANVKTDVWIDELDIKLVIPQYSKKGRKYPNRLIVTTSTDTYVLNHTFKDLMNVVDKSVTKIGFKNE